MSINLVEEYKEENTPSLLAILCSEKYDDIPDENWIESFQTNILNKMENSQMPFIQKLTLALKDIKNIYSIENIIELISECPPQFFEILLIYLTHIIRSPGFKIQQLLDYDLIFKPLTENAQSFYFEFPQNTNFLICFFRSLFSNKYFYTFFIQNLCIKIPFDFISLLYSDKAYDMPNCGEEEREKFYTSLMSNCILLIGDFFNYDMIINSPEFENSISQLLYNIKCPKSLISCSAIEGTIKAIKISPQNTIDMIFEENFFPDLISILSKDEEFNGNDELFGQVNLISEQSKNQQLDQENIKIGILNLIYFIIKYDKQNKYFFQIVESIPDQLHMLMQKSENFQIKSLKILLILSQSLSSDEQNALFKFEATHDSVQFLMTDSSFNLKILSFQYFSSLMKYPDYQFFKSHLIMFEYISQLIWSLSFSDICEFIQSLKILLSLFSQRDDNSLNIFLIQCGFVEELTSLTNNTADDNDKNEINEIINFINSLQTN